MSFEDQVRAALEADRILEAERGRSRRGGSVAQAVVATAVVIVLAAGWVTSRLVAGGTAHLAAAPAEATSPSGSFQPADAGCLELWNGDATFAAQRALLATRTDTLVMITRVQHQLPGGLIPAGACGVVVYDRSNGATYSYASGIRSTGFADVTGHTAARMLGRIHGPYDANAGMLADGTLRALTAPAP